AFDLAVEKEGGAFAEADFLFLEDLGFVVVREDGFGVGFVFGVFLAGAVGFEEFLDAGVAGGGIGSAFLDDAVFGLDFFEEVSDFSGQIGNWKW
ncbi:MAG: hypothetical protein Q9193_005457, partial [Seirophora villosa]